MLIALVLIVEVICIYILLGKGFEPLNKAAACFVLSVCAWIAWFEMGKPTSIFWILMLTAGVGFNILAGMLHLSDWWKNRD